MTNPLISVVINCDTRPENLNEGGLSKGVVSRDFLIEGVFNKQKFFEGFDIETILFVDKHEEISPEELSVMYRICDTVVIRKHTNEHAFNDYNYLSALQLARGKYICHFDQDVAAFTSSPEPINQMIRWLEDYKFVSYPSYWSPKAVDDPSFGNRTWASTRFFICKRESLKFDVLKACIDEPEWAYQTFGDSPRRCNWTEHFLTLSNNDSCYYPPMSIGTHAIFTWGSYHQWLLRRLNGYSYEEVKDWLNSHPIVYPVDVHV